MRDFPRRLAALALVLCLGPTASADDEEGFEPLVKGDDPAQFRLVGIGPDAIRIADGVVHVSGRPNGYFATKEDYGNYVLRFEWMYERPEGYREGDRFDGNSGLLLHITGEHKVWPKCIEVQLANSDAGHIFAINGASFSGKRDAEAQKRAIRPVGEWNREEVTCQGDRIACTINGIEVDRGTGATPDRGSIGWQSEGRPIRFRNLRIKRLDPRSGGDGAKSE